jgi:hypothetical protein
VNPPTPPSPFTTISFSACLSIVLTSTRSPLPPTPSYLALPLVTGSCNVYFPKYRTFLRDLCTVDGPPCIDDTEAEHASCCCLLNPLAQINVVQPANSSGSAAAAGRQLKDAAGGAAQGSTGARDVCAESYQVSGADASNQDTKIRKRRTPVVAWAV